MRVTETLVIITLQHFIVPMCAPLWEGGRA